MWEVFVGVDLGGTNIKIGCFDGGLSLLGKTSIPSEVELGPVSIIDRIGAAVEKILGDSGQSAENIVAAGIGSPGVMDIEASVVIAAGNMKFENVPLRKMLSERLNCPAVLENDANVTCWGEYAADAGKGAEDMVLLTLGTGIGGGIISGGELVHGFCNNAAELGHVVIYPDGRLCGCGQRGCAETYASASATAARATEAIEAGGESSLAGLLEDNGEITCKDVYENAVSGDKLAKEITDGTARALAILCINILHATGPVRIILYGGMIGAGNVLLEAVRKYFDEYIWTLKEENVQICFATLGADAGIIGTAALAQKTVKN